MPSDYDANVSGQVREFRSCSNELPVSGILSSMTNPANGDTLIISAEDLEQAA
jgi:hypothetical protein